MTFSYLDAAAGSGLVAILGGGLAGAAVAWRMLRDRVRPGRRSDEPATGKPTGDAEAPPA